jgi:hypothetical protein
MHYLLSSFNIFLGENNFIMEFLKEKIEFIKTIGLIRKNKV